MSTTTLFTPAELAEWLGQPVTPQRGVLVERVVWGWLKPVLKLDDRPTPVSEQLFAWAIELGGIAKVNPEGLASYELENEKSDYSSERRDEILRAAAGGGVIPAGSVAAPVGCFPSARRYPDPAERC